ncbi:hypothetical protein SNEBB_010002 [Seison nebaliae]|nr:hypothetical protein SNEBB_010002 [Seison nebaliae]
MQISHLTKPAVIDEEMLKKGSTPKNAKFGIGRSLKDDIKFEEVKNLQLDFENILRIENLWQFKAVTRLKLDNNIIGKIAGLEDLIHLEWLDLSFNFIEVIENISHLKKLTDLSLYHNRIRKIENMETLKHLQILSIGANELTDLNDIIYLRRFDNLRSLCVNGNPFCEEKNYMDFVLSHLPSIKFLDYRIVKETKRMAAITKFEIDLQQLQQTENQEKKIQEKKEEEERLQEIYKAAYVDNLDGSGLFDLMFELDADGLKINLIGTIRESVEEYQQKFVAISKEIFELGLTEKTKRDDELKELMEVVNDVKDTDNKRGSEAIRRYLQEKEELAELVEQTEDLALIDDKCNAAQERLEDLWKFLMTNEMQLVDQIEDLIREWERQTSDVIATFKENLRNLFMQLRDAEGLHNEKLSELCFFTLDKVLKGEFNEDEVPEVARELFVDKDNLTNSLTQSHDLHLNKIDQKEEKINQALDDWFSSQSSQLHEQQEYRRNRQRILEINRLLDELRGELDDLIDKNEPIE